MELNKIYHDDWMNNQLPDKSVQLIIADPPYFEVKGSFDFVWKSFDDYLKDVEKWAIACHNLGFDLWTCEIDKTYFAEGNERLRVHQSQLVMF